MSLFTYDEITEKTEKEIRCHLAKAQSMPNQEYRHDGAACGAFFLWEKITIGYRKESDLERLGRLIGLEFSGKKEI